MRLSKYIPIVVILLLSACAATQKTTVTPQPAVKSHKVPVSLERMDVQFLYLAAQRALGQGQIVLAVRFLNALLKKNPEAVEPRLELADLLLGEGKRGMFKQAKQVLELMPASVFSTLQGEQLSRYQLYLARALLVNEELEQAATLLQGLLKKNPENIQVRMLLVRLLVVQKDVKQAHAVLRVGIKKHDDLRLRQAQVQLYLQQGKLKKADKALAAMQKKYPDHENIVSQRSQLAEQQGKFKKAERYLQRFIALHGDEAVASYHALANFYVRQERFAKAVATYQKLLSLTSSVADVAMSLGKVYYQIGEYNHAAEVFGMAVSALQVKNKRAVITEPLATAYFYLGASLEASHAWEKAIPVYNHLQPKHRHYLDAQLRLVNIEITQQEVAAAETRLLRLKTLFGAKLEVHEVLSSLRLQQKDYTSLLKETKEAMALGYSSMLLFNRAIAFDALKQYDRLDDALNTVLNKEPEHNETLNFYAYSLAERGVRLVEAQGMVEKALRIKPDDGYYLDSLAWVYFKQKKYKKALGLQLKAVKKVEDDPIMLEHLGDMYWRTGKAEQARIFWQQSIALKHEHPEDVQRKIEHGLQ